MPMIIKHQGIAEYHALWQQMLDFTIKRDLNTPDEIWITEHPSVYTLGLNGKLEHLLQETKIPVIKTDRGGQITYHGIGQLVIYPLLDLSRLQINPRQLVSLLEITVINTLAQYGLQAVSKPEAPGVYIAEQKIASIGLRIKKNCCYHGFSLNHNMDLTPFNAINTCGFPDLKVTQLHDHAINITKTELAFTVIQTLLTALKL